MRTRPTHGHRRVRLAAFATFASVGGIPAGAAGPEPRTVALRADHPDVSGQQAGAMTPAALGDVLLAPGHPPIVEARLSPRGWGAPPPPPGSPIRLEVKLSFAATRDAESGFCVRRSVTVTTMRPGAATPETIVGQTDYRLPTAGRTGCAGLHASFFSPVPADRPRAFEVVRLVAAAAHGARRVRVPFPISVDDPLDRDMTRWLASHPEEKGPGGGDAEITDGRAALVAVPMDAIDHIGRDLFAGGALLAPARPSTPRGPRERWVLTAGDGWTVDVVLDGDRIAAMALRRQMPPPF